MSREQLSNIAEKLCIMRKFSALMGCATGKSQGALIKDLTPEQTAIVAEMVLELMTNEPQYR